jgi:hypothetical protein
MAVGKLAKIIKSRLGHGARVVTGDFRARERFGLVYRRQYAYGLLRSADIAKYFGHSKVTACEFGVASGAGLVNMIQVAEKVTALTGVAFDIFGLDTGTGIPEGSGYKDHPEIWGSGDYPLNDHDGLMKRIAGRGELILGDIKDTVEPFLERIDATAPLGFIAIDVDVYTGAHHAIKCLLGESDRCLPAVSMYFDDVNNFFANRWCGELLAIEEFNTVNPMRKIDMDRSQRHQGKKWFDRMYVCHVLDHPARNAAPEDRGAKKNVGGNSPPGVLH